MIKQRYEIDGRSWLRIPHAAKLAGFSVATIRKMMGAGTLEWCQLRTGSKTFLVDEQAIISLRLERHQATKEAAKRTRATLATAQKRGRSQLAKPPAEKGGGVFVRTWDPNALPLPISGRATPKDSAAADDETP